MEMEKVALSAESNKLPSFRDPPLVEVVLGVSFEAVPQVTVAHLGRWWEILGRSEYPRCEEQPPLTQILEPSGPAMTQLEFGIVPPRVWFISRTDDQIVQVQRDRFLCNWRKTSTQQVYPRYEAVSGTFFRQFAQYRDFVRTETGKELTLVQCELTYVNHIVDGALAGFAGIGGILPDLSWRATDRYLPSPSGIETRFSFDRPDRRSRMHAKINTGRRTIDDSPVVILDLTVRGFDPDLVAWFASAHEWIVRGFADLTSGAAHRNWGRVT